MTLAALYATAVGLGYFAVRVPEARIWMLLPLLAAAPVLIEGGLHGPGSCRRSRAHPVFRRWVEGAFPFERDD